LSEPHFEAIADDAWLVRLGDATSDPATLLRVHRLVAQCGAESPPWLRDVVPAYASLAIFFDSNRIDADAVRDWLAARCVDAVPATDHRTARVVEIPVHYGGAFGEDFDSAAAELGLAAATLIERHAAPLYTVAMIGFAPGFPYLSGLDPSLALPRLTTPRTRVPAGSVGIGGAQTGIYPRASPGGWRLIGRTPLRLFDPLRDGASLLRPGDRVRFVAIDEARFAALEHGG
jgi:KipI family sensor histidine kinase inhibitor